MDSKITGTVFLGTGSNEGNRKDNLEKALEMIRARSGEILISSSLYETEPWGFEADTPFLNMVVKIETRLDPVNLLENMLSIERSMGRKRETKGYSSRIIDIDILFYDNLILESQNLHIPHPLLHKRLFVLVPLAEIAPDLIHPVYNKSILSLLSSCTDTSKVIKL